MGIRIDISEEHQRILHETWGEDLARAALEALIVEGYRSRKLDAATVGKLLGLTDRWDVNRWLADRHVPLRYSIQDIEADVPTRPRALI